MFRKAETLHSDLNPESVTVRFREKAVLWAVITEDEPVPLLVDTNFGRHFGAQARGVITESADGTKLEVHYRLRPTASKLAYVTLGLLLVSLGCSAWLILNGDKLPPFALTGVATHILALSFLWSSFVSNVQELQQDLQRVVCDNKHDEDCGPLTL